MHALAPEIDEELHDLARRRTIHRNHDHRLAVRKRQPPIRRVVHGFIASVSCSRRRSRMMLWTSWATSSFGSGNRERIRCHA